MQPDDEICICFHVRRRQIEKFLRLEKPRRVSQISECYGAGTGCGWCVPFLEKLFEHHARAESPETLDLDLSPSEYRARRQNYLRTSHTARQPPAEPGAPPINEPDRLADEIDSDIKPLFSGD